MAEEMSEELAEKAGLPLALREFALLSMLLTIGSTLYCVLARFLFHKGMPWDWPMLNRHDSFGDFTIYQGKFSFFHTRAFFQQGYPFTYPSPMAVVYEVFFLLHGRLSVWAFVSVFVLSFVIAGILFARVLKERGLRTGPAAGFAALCVLFSWPAAVLLDRGNGEVFVWLALALAVFEYAKGREWTAAGCFGLAASLKLFPVIYFVLFLSRRRANKLVFGVAVFAVTTVVSLLVLGPTLPTAYAGIQHGLADFEHVYVEQYNNLPQGFDHSLLGLAKTVLVAVRKKHYEPQVVRMARLYTPTMAVLGIALYLVRIRKLPWLNQVTALTIVSILFTPFSGDGTLIHLYNAFVLIVLVALDASRRRLSVPGLRWILWCFAFLFSVQNFYIAAQRRFEGQMRCLALVLLLLLVLRFPLSAPLDEGAEPGELSLADASRI